MSRGSEAMTGVLERLSSVIDEALLMLDPDGSICFVSAACRTMLAASEEATEATALLAAVHPEDRARLASLLADPARAPGRTRLRVRSQGAAWRRVEVRTERTASGSVARFIDVVRGVPAPGDARDPLELIASHLEDVLWLIDLDRQSLLYVSEGYEAMFGRSRETLQTGPDAFYDAVFPDDLEGLLKAASDGLETGFEHEFRVVLPDGTLRWVRQRSVPVRVAGSPRPLAVGITQDVHERKRAEQDRRAGEQRFEVLAGNAFDVLSEVDERGRVLWSSRSDRRPSFASPDPASGAPRVDLIHDDDRAQVQAAFHDAFRRGEQAIFEYRASDVNGRWYWIETIINPFVTDSGERRALFVTRDVSKRRELLQQLSDSEERFRLLAENSHDLIAEYDENARLLYANQRVMDAAGFSFEECAAMSPFEGVHPEDRPLVEARLSDLAREQRAIFLTFRRQHRDGSWFWFESHMHMHHTAAGDARMVVIARDITERKAAEDRIRESEERYRLLVERSPEAIVVHAAGRLLYANPAALALAGAGSASDLAGRPIADWIEAAAGTAESVPGAGAERSQYRVRRLDGALRDVLGSDSRITYAGRPAVQTVFRDITEWRRSEREREQLQLQLQEARKLESLGVLAGGIAHDFNNLLAVILGNARFSLRRAAAADGVSEALSDVIDAAESAARLTRQLLAYAGRRAPEVRPVDLSEHVRSVAGLLEAAVPKKVSLRFDLAEELPSVRADVVQLEQVTMNLVRNAADAIGDDDGRVEVTTGSVNASARDLHAWTGSEELAPGLYAYLEVRDSGCGMTVDTRQRIFDPFFTTKDAGHGLGLSAVHGLVRGHDGGIAIESAPGRGTSIRVLLPASQDVAPSQPLRAPAATPPRATVLVVDDEPGIRRMARRILESGGCTVLEAGDGLEALARVRAGDDAIDVVLLDLNMPRASGEETLAAIRSVAPTLPVLLSSGDDQSGLAERIEDDSRAAFIAKPYRDDDLLARLGALLDGPPREEGSAKVSAS